MKQIPYTQLSQSGLTGSLGHGLGQLVTVEGQILDTTDMKDDEGKIRLRIDKVDGKALGKPVVLPLEFFSFSAPPRPKAGDKVKYIGYETGAFTGIPGKAFEHIPRVASQDYHFALAFQVCKALK